jgi:hypothetical protein
MTAVLMIPNYNPSYDISMPTCLFLDASYYHNVNSKINFNKVRYSRIHAVTQF